MMHKKDFIQLNDRIYLIDGFDLGVPERTGTYVFDEEELTLVDTGPSPSVKYVKQGIRSIGVFAGSSEVYHRDAYPPGSLRRGWITHSRMPECYRCCTSERGKALG